MFHFLTRPEWWDIFFIELFQEKKDEEKKPAEEAKKAKEPKAKKPVSHVQDFEEDMVYLFQFTRSPQVSENYFCKTQATRRNILDPLNFSVLSEVGVVAEASRYQVSGRRFIIFSLA